jgi:transcription antitermination factor NusG
MARKNRPNRRRPGTNLRGHKVASAWVNGRRWRIEYEPIEQSLPALKSGDLWYVAEVARRLDQVEQELRELGFEVFVPRRCKTETRQRDKRTTYPPVFVGYIFVAFDGSPGKQAKITGISPDKPSYGRKRIDWHDPVTGEVFSANVSSDKPDKPRCELIRSPVTNAPVAIPEEVLSEFVGEVSRNAAPVPLRAKFKRDDAVTVTGGPFEGLSAVIERSEQDVADVLLEIMGAKRSVRVPLESLEAA